MKRPYEEIRAEINVTPLVDVVLVLLIIFMVVTPMLERGIDVRLPFAERAETDRDTGERLVVSVRKDGAVFLDRVEVTLDHLQSYLRTALRNQAGRPVLVKADSSLTFGQVRGVLETCHEAGSVQVSLATEETN